MKKALLFLTAAGCLALPVLSHANEPATTKAGKKVVPSKGPAVVTKAAPKQERVIYYITTETRTGSLIPMTYRRYNGRVDSASNAGVYGSSAINNTGQLDVASSLVRLDSSISFGRAH